MIPVLSVDAMRRSDAETIARSVPGRELMLRAGKQVFESVRWTGPVGILCGTGNNAGDGYVLARLLREAGFSCTVFLLREAFSPDGLFYFQQCREAGAEIRLWEDVEDLSGFATLVDCLFGTGFRGPVEGTARRMIERINASSAFVVSVDINSGLNGDNGLADLCVRSDLTVSVGFFQPGHFLNMAKDVMKRKINREIGIEPLELSAEWVQAEDLRPLFSPRLNDSHKGTYGYLALIGGSRRYGGAIRLAAMANAAMRSGAGVVKAALPDSLVPELAPLILESTVFPLSEQQGELFFREEEIGELISNVRAAAFGMGIGTSAGAAGILRFLLSRFSGRLVVDADGLTLLAQLDREAIRSAAGLLVLTPHLKEFSRLSGLSVEEIRRNPIGHARRYARDTGVILLLKGPATVITDGTRTLLTDTGCPGMATAGSGDVLSGILSALLGWAPDPLTAAAAAAWINGRAGENAQRKTNAWSMTAGDTVAAIPGVISALAAPDAG